MSVEVIINLNGRVQRLVEVVEGEPVVLNKCFSIMDKIYRAFIRLRWRRFSRGGGDWKPLKPATVKRKSSELILIDSSLAYQSVNPEFEEVFSVQPAARTKYQATVTFGSDASYPSGLTVNQVMSYHQEGGGYLPQRKVLVSPDTATKRNMERKLKEHVKAYLKKRK